MKGLVLLVLLLACAACVKEKAPGKPPLAVAAQRVAALDAASLGQPRQASRYTAVLAPRELVKLAFKVPGYVEYLDPKALDKGARVFKGQVLARLRQSDFKAKVDQARSSLDEARASQALADEDHKRNARLIERQVISASEFDRAKERQKVTQAKVAQAAASLEQASIELRDATLAAPMDGWVVRREVERGSLVAQGGVAFELADLSSVKAVFGLPDQDVARMSLGTPLELTLDAAPGRTFAGTVTAVSPSADPKSRAFEVEVSLPNPDGLLRDGMIASVRQSASRTPGPLPAVPLSALARPAGEEAFVVHVLARQQDGKDYAVERVVRIAGVAGNMVGIASGLEVDEEVVTRGTTLASQGQEVRVIR